MPTEAEVRSALIEAGLEIARLQPFEITPALQDFFLYSGKQRPEMYLSQSVRAGISSFRNGFCSAIELETGLARLRSDIASGDIASVAKRYQSSLGDYMFFQARKL